MSPPMRCPIPRYRMKLWSTDDPREVQVLVLLSRLKKVKKANGQILACNEIFEEDVTTSRIRHPIRYQLRPGSTTRQGGTARCP